MAPRCSDSCYWLNGVSLSHLMGHAQFVMFWWQRSILFHQMFKNTCLIFVIRITRVSLVHQQWRRTLQTLCDTSSILYWPKKHFVSTFSWPCTLITMLSSRCDCLVSQAELLFFTSHNIKIVNTLLDPTPPIIQLDCIKGSINEVLNLIIATNNYLP